MGSTGKNAQAMRAALAKISERPNQAIRYCGEAFHETAAHLRESSKGRPFHEFVVPSIVNAALALEYYLKSLNAAVVERDASAVPPEERIWQTDEPVNRSSHDPSILYADLEHELQAHLEAEYAGTEPRRHQNLAAALNAQDGVFVRWRYYFEGGNDGETDVDGLFALLDFLRGCVKRLPAPFRR